MADVRVLLASAKARVGSHPAATVVLESAAAAAAGEAGEVSVSSEMMSSLRALATHPCTRSSNGSGRLRRRSQAAAAGACSRHAAH
ncbi:MAG: hypothetical protein AAF467_00430 [Actinomycetota bacterium]